jgi:hypothetical protein
MGAGAGVASMQGKFMPSVLHLSVFAALLLGLASPLSPARATAHDGNWSVVVITEKGGCDRAYRYSVRVADGRVRYSGDTSVDLNGTVAANGAVKVSIRFGGQGAVGAGRLSGNTGAGTWRGNGASGVCSGRWEAEKR